MQCGEPGQRGEFVVDNRVVFHRARAERIELKCLPEIQLRQTEEMPDHLRLAQLRETLDICAAVFLAEKGAGAALALIPIRHVEAGSPRRGFFENQRRST